MIDTLSMLQMVANGEKDNGAFESKNKSDEEVINYLYRQGLVNKFEFVKGLAATLNTKGVMRLSELNNAAHRQ